MPELPVISFMSFWSIFSSSISSPSGEVSSSVEGVSSASNVLVMTPSFFISSSMLTSPSVSDGSSSTTMQISLKTDLRGLGGRLEERGLVMRELYSSWWGREQKGRFWEGQVKVLGGWRPQRAQRGGAVGEERESSGGFGGASASVAKRASVRSVIEACRCLSSDCLSLTNILLLPHKKLILLPQLPPQNLTPLTPPNPTNKNTQHPMKRLRA